MTTTYAEGSIRAAVQTANHIRNRHGDYRSAIQSNHSMAISFARSLNDMSIGDADLDEELNKFAMEQKLRLVKIAEQNAALERKIDAFDSALIAITSYLEQNHDEQDCEALLASELDKSSRNLTSAELQLDPKVHELLSVLDLPISGDEQVEDELQVINNSSTQTLKCPISAAIFEDPVRNKVCKHIYSKSALEQYLEQKKRKRDCPCPVVGCSNRNLTLQSCEPDYSTAMAVKRYQRKLAHQQELQMSQAANVDSDGECEFG